VGIIYLFIWALEGDEGTELFIAIMVVMAMLVWIGLASGLRGGG